MRPDSDEIPHDLAFAYPLKAAFENILGHGTFLKLKECHDVRVWKAQSERLLRASLVAFSATIEISDDEFKAELADEIQLGLNHVKSARNINAVFSSLAATYARLSFLQLGIRLNRWNDATLRKNEWKLDTFRTVMYLQTDKQKRNLAIVREQRRERATRINAEAENLPA